jgi:hypothetical protein
MKRLILLAIPFAALAGSATAQIPGPEGRGFGLLQFDANADGKLTKAEFEAGQRARFNQLDGDKDGVATPEEMAAGFKAQAQAAMESAKKQRFAELDKDKNGQLSQSEFLAADGQPDGRGLRIRLPFRDGPGPRLMDRGPPGAPDAPGPGRGPRESGRKWALAGPPDADGDSKLTFAEFSARGNEAFARADANKDGVVTIAELQASAPGIR